MFYLKVAGGCFKALGYMLAAKVRGKQVYLKLMPNKTLKWVIE